jgi:peptide subunit release factor 1 (eRF1)
VEGTGDSGGTTERRRPARTARAGAVEDARGYEERADRIGAETVLVPADSEDGDRFETAFGGVGALLRFPIE